MKHAGLTALARLDWGDHPVTPGRLLYLLKQKFGDGWRVAWYREVIRPQILSTPPVRTGDASCELHVLTSSRDWLNLLWALRSFYHYSGRACALCIHDDGSLNDEARRELKAAFPDARLISREQANQRLASLLAPYPRSRALRASNNLALKVFDFAAFLAGDRMLIFDCDLLFFSRPAGLLGVIDASRNNSLNRDWRAGYTLSPEVIAALGFDLPPLINSGLGLIHQGSLRLDWIEDFLALPGILSHPHQIEQTLIALCSAKFGFQMLPPEYDVHTGPRRPGTPVRHYAGPMRPLFYAEGMRLLVKEGFLSP